MISLMVILQMFDTFETRRVQGSQFNSFWTMSSEYFEEDTIKKFIWRRLNDDSEVDPDSGTIQESAFPSLCSKGKSLQDSKFSKWRILSLNDIHGTAFQKLLLENSEFGAYRLNGRITLKHKLAMQPMRSSLADRLTVVLIVGNDRRDFQVDIYPYNQHKNRAKPTDVLCVSSKSTVPNITLPPKTNTIAFSSTKSASSGDHRTVLSDCGINSSAAAVAVDVIGGRLAPLDVFLIRNRAPLFVLTLCCGSLLILVAVLLICLVQRYRSQHKHRQKLMLGINDKTAPATNDRVVRSFCSHNTNSIENSSHGASLPLWPRSTSMMLTSEQQRNGAIKNNSCCDVSSNGFGTCHHHHYHNRHQQKHSQLKKQQLLPTCANKDTNKSNVPLPDPVVHGGAKVVHVPSSEVDLGAIAARRFRDTMRCKSAAAAAVEQYTGINGNSAIYSSLHQNEPSTDTTTSSDQKHS